MTMDAGIKKRRGLFFIALFLFAPMAQAEQGVHKLVIEKVEVVRTASGIDTAGYVAIGLGSTAAVLVGGAAVGAGAGGALATATTVKAGATAVGTAAGTASSIAGGTRAAEEVLRSESLGGLGARMSSDDLIISVNGKTVFDAEQFAIAAGILNSDSWVQPGVVIDFTNLSVSFVNGATLRLIENDSGSDDDNLGSFSVNVNQSTSKREPVEKAGEEDSAYMVTYRVEKNAGSIDDIAEWVMCGSNQCLECQQADCYGQEYSELDRDGDHGDLLDCPAGYTRTRYQEYRQIVVDDVFTAVCQQKSLAVMKVGVSANASDKPMMYGDTVYVLNNYNNEGTYLDTNGAGCEGNLLCVSTSVGVRAAQYHTNEWVIESASGGKSGPVNSGDDIRLRNRYPQLPHVEGGYLDTNGSGCERSDTLCVSTSAVKDRAQAGTDVWRIEVSSLGTVNYGEYFILTNKWTNYTHSLDTLGRGCEGNAYCVSANPAVNRDVGSGVWSAVKVR